MRSAVIVGSAALLAVVASVGSTACSSSDDSGTVSVADSGVATACELDTRKDVYAAGLTKTTPSNLALKIMTADPAPPEKDMNTMVVELLDPTGKPLDGATITVVPWMPDHGHGSAVKPTVTPMGGGIYNITNIDYVMPGLWQLNTTISSSATPAPEATVFSFCIDG